MTVQCASILYVGDDRAEMEQVIQYLAEHAPHMEIHTVATLEDYLRELEEHPFDAVLAHHPLPGATAARLLEESKKGGRNVPVVFIAEKGAWEEIAEAFAPGTAHFVIRGEGCAARALRVLEHAVENQRQAAHRARQAALLTQITHVGEQMRLQLTLSAVLDFICNAIHDTLGWERAIVRMRDGTGSFSRPVSVVGFSADRKSALLSGAPSPVTEWYADERFRVGYAYFIPSLLSQADVECPEGICAAMTVGRLDGHGENHWHPDDLLVMPIDGPSGRLGTILVADPANHMRPTPRAIRGLEILANQAATAIESAYLYRQISLEKGRFQLLDEIGHQVSSSLDLNRVLREVLSLTITSMEADRGSILVIEEGGQVSYRILSPKLERDERASVVSPVLDDGLSRWVLDHRVGVLIADVRQDKRWYTFPDERWPSRSVICVPLKVREKVRAVMTITHTHPRHFDGDDLRLAEAIADRVAWAVENAWLYGQTDEELRSRVAELEALNTIAAAVSRSLDLDQILDNALNQILRATSIGGGAVHLWGVGTEVLALRANQGLPAELEARLESISLPDVGLPEETEGLGSPVLVDLIRDPQTEFISQAAEMGYRTLISVPLQARGHFLGSVALLSHRALQMGPEMTRLLIALGRQLGMAVENARLFGETRRRAEQLATINAIGESVSRVLDEDAILNTCLERLLAAVGAECGGVYLRKEESLVLRAHRGFPQWFTDGCGPIALDGDLPPWVKAAASARERLWEHEGGIPEADKKLGIQSWASCPLVAGDELLGVVVLSSLAYERFSDAETNILATVSHQAAAAIRNARLFQAEQERADQLEIIHAVTAMASGSLDPREIVSMVIERAMALTGMEIGGAYFREESGDLVLAGQKGMDPSYLPQVTRLESGQGIVGYVAERGQMSYTTDYSGQDWVHPVPSSSVRTTVAFPLQATGRLLGVAFLASTEERELAPDILRLLQVIADEVAVAIQNARLFTGIQQAEEHQRAILDSSIDAVVSGDAERGITVWSAGAEEIFGWSREEALAQPLGIIAFEDNGDPRQIDMIQLLRPEGFIRNYATRARHKDGHLIDTEVSASLLKAIDGEGMGFTAVIRDITARLQRERLLQALNEAATAMAAATTPEEIFNAAATVFLGLDIQCLALTIEADREHLRLAHNSLDPRLLRVAKRLLGRSLSQLSVPIDQNETYARVIRERVSLVSPDPLEAVIGKAAHRETEAKRALRKFMSRSVAISAPLIVEGTVMGVLSVRSPALQEENVPAITAFAHQLAAAWHKAELFETLQESMKHLRATQARLVQSEKLSAIGEMVSGVAHELNNPLTAVMGYSQLLESAELNPIAREDVRKIRRAADRCARIVKDLLTFARQYQPERTLVQVNDLLDQTLAMRSYQLRVQNIHVVREYALDLPQITGDPHRLQEVFVNLLTNAEQSMSEAHGRGTLTVRTMVRTAGPEPQPAAHPPALDVPSPALRIEFEDDGSGIPPDIMEHIFDPFFTTREVGKGTGLGLSICYGIIGEHDGRIWAENREEGEGTRFVVELAISTAESAELVGLVPDEDPGTEEANMVVVKGKTVLVIDDEEPVASLLCRILEPLGCQVTTAYSGDEALAHLETREFDAIICDLKMPGLSGQELYRQVRQRRPDLAERFIFVTGDVITPGTGHFLACVGRLGLAKPFTAAQIADVLQEMLEGQEEKGE